MASKRRKTVRRRRRAAAPAKTTRRRYRRNPSGVRASLKNLPEFAMGAAIGAATSVGGVIAVRKVRGMLGKEPGSVMGSAIEAAAAIAGGLALSHFVNPRVGADFARGGLMAPMMTAVQQLGIPHISDSLGDDGFLIGGDTGLGLISAWPDGTGETYAGYLPGPGTQGALGAYTTGYVNS